MAALDDYDLTPITHSESAALDSLVLDVEDRKRFGEVLADQDVLVHLAANPSPDAAWADVREPNLDGTYNAYAAAVDNDLDRVVFASSNHAVHGYNVAEPGEPESLVDDPRAVAPDDPPKPDSLYGVTKVAGEALGSYFADRHGLEVVNLRIGWLMTPEELVETQAGPDDHARFARAMWLSPRDCRQALRLAATRPVRDSPVTAHAISRNDDRYLALTGSLRALGYSPADEAIETIETVREGAP